VFSNDDWGSFPGESRAKIHGWKGTHVPISSPVNKSEICEKIEEKRERE
jgi:hypothetical protein